MGDARETAMEDSYVDSAYMEYFCSWQEASNRELYYWHPTDDWAKGRKADAWPKNLKIIDWLERLNNYTMV